MKKFTLTKHIFAAVLAVVVGFTGCQKSEMDEVDPMRSSIAQEVIAGACGVTLEDISLQRNIKNDGNETLGAVEIGNTKTHLILQFTSEHAIRKASAYINGQLYTLLNNSGEEAVYLETDEVHLIQILVPKTVGSTVRVSNIEMMVYVNINGESTHTVSNRVEDDTKDNYFVDYTYQACEVKNCSWDKDYWKQNPGEWPANFSLTIQGQTYYQSYLLPLLSTGNANDNIIKLTQAYTVAKLNAANGANLNEVMGNGKTLGQAIAEAEAYFNNPSPKLPAGIVGRLHQLPSCL